MNKYLEYKLIDFDSIDSIPSAWSISKVKYVGDIIGRIGYRGYTVNDLVQQGQGAISLSPSNIKNQKLVLDDCTYLSWDKYYESPEIQIFPEDIIIVKTGSTIGKVAIIPDGYEEEMTLNPQLVVLKKAVANPKFIYYYFTSYLFQANFKIYTAGGSTPAISQEKINDFEIILPPIEEQIQIGIYLDIKTSEIDNIIAAKKKLIGLYKEEKIAIISQAVTKGINSDVELKPSGLEWLGDIPENWKTVSLKWVSKIYSGGTPSKNQPDYWNNGNIPWLNSGAVNQGFITDPSEYITEEALANSSAKWIPEFSLVMALAGQGKTKGMVAQVLFETTCNQSLGVIVPSERIDNKFLMYWLRKNYQNIRNLGGGDKRDGINLEMIGSIPVPLTSIEEQTQIVNYIEEQLSGLNSKIKKANQLIELLTEYRTTLVSEVVTGKINVTS